jgi:hypothetical protein
MSTSLLLFLLLLLPLGIIIHLFDLQTGPVPISVSSIVFRIVDGTKGMAFEFPMNTWERTSYMACPVDPLRFMQQGKVLATPTLRYTSLVLLHPDVVTAWSRTPLPVNGINLTGQC